MGNDDKVTLEVTNSLGTAIDAGETMESTGLGTQLMRAFVMQLNAQSEIEQGEDVYHLWITFLPTAFSPEG